MPGEMTVSNSCLNHSYEKAADACPDCGANFCEECLVPPLRRRQPRRCVECALVAAGIRTRKRRASL